MHPRQPGRGCDIGRAHGAREIGLDEFDRQPLPLRRLPRDRDVRREQLDADDLKAAPAQLQRMPAGPTAQVEDPLVAARLKDREDPVDFSAGLLRPPLDLAPAPDSTARDLDRCREVSALRVPGGDSRPIRR